MLESQAQLTGSEAEAWSPGNRALHTLGLERGLRLCGFDPLLFLKTGDGYSVAVRSGPAALHTNDASRPPGATGYTKTEALDQKQKA